MPPLPPEQAVYAEGLRALAAARAPFLVGGGWALFNYLGRWRTTKDIDIFVAPERAEETLNILARAGFHTERTDPAWLGKAFRNGALIDVIFCSYNGLFPVDDTWFVNGRDARVLGVDVRVVGPEEIIVSKSFVAARDRFDGADVSWLIRATAHELDWNRIERLMRDHWQVLLWQLMHFPRLRLPRRAAAGAEDAVAAAARALSTRAGDCADRPRSAAARCSTPSCTSARSTPLAKIRVRAASWFSSRKVDRLTRADPRIYPTHPMIVPHPERPACPHRRMTIQESWSLYDLAARGTRLSSGRRLDRRGQAMTLAANEPFDAVVLDVELPDGSGPDLAEKLRKIPALATAAIVGMSSYPSSGPSSCFDAFLSKPLHGPQAAGATVLRRSAQQAALRSPQA